MAEFDDLGLQLDGPRDGGVEVVHLKPKKHAVAVGSHVRIRDPPMLVSDLPLVQLKHQLSVPNQPLVRRAAVIALEIQQALIPAAGRLDIADADEGLRFHEKELYIRPAAGTPDSRARRTLGLRCPIMKQGRPTPTREWIMESFNRLMLKRDYDRFGVTDVVTGAGVGRSTFYEHYRGKDEVLRDAVRHVVEAMADLVSRPDEEGPMRRVAEHIATHRPAAHRILAGTAGVRIARLLAELIASRLSRTTVSTSGPADLSDALIAQCLAGAQLGLLRAWVAPVFEPCSPATFATGLRRSTRAILEALRGGRHPSESANRSRPS